MKTLYLIRHGETAWNVERRMQGRLDSPLTPEGVEQARTHGALLKTEGRIEKMFVSPSGRTRETAYIINSYVHATIEFDDALLERDVGEWSGLKIDEVEARYPQAWRARIEDPYGHAPPAGESLAQMTERTREFVESLHADPADVVAVVTHQVTSRVIISQLLQLPPAQTIRVLHPNRALYRFVVGSEGIDAAHFVSGEGPVDGLLQRGDDETIPSLSRGESQGEAEGDVAREPD